jgi:hypothetical protein
MYSILFQKSQHSTMLIALYFLTPHKTGALCSAESVAKSFVSIYFFYVGARDEFHGASLLRRDPLARLRLANDGGAARRDAAWQVPYRTPTFCH